MIDCLAEAMQTSAAREIDAVRPDLIGEAFVLEIMRHREAKRANLSGQLAALLEEEPKLADELRALLPAAKVCADTMTQTIGTGGKGAQTKGDGNTVTIS